MSILTLLKSRFRDALAPLAADPGDLLELVRPSQDPRFGDYQANFAMPLGKKLDRPAPEVAREVVGRLDVADFCAPAEVAGPGFINLRLSDAWLAGRLAALVADPRLGVQPAAPPRTIVVDYSAPNVAKPMHVGHIRSTVIGDALCRMLRFMGHRAIGDNHLGDWGTQFGMILYGWKHFRDEAAYAADPVTELARLYKLVNRLVGYYEAREELPKLRGGLEAARAEAARLASAPQPADKNAQKQAAQAKRKAETSVREAEEKLAECEGRIASVDADAALADLAQRHPAIASTVLAETARLHSGGEENLHLWRQFMPHCLADIERIYRRLGVTFDVTLGESFYHDRLAGVVEDLLARGVATVTAGAVGVFLEGYDTPFLIRKHDGAFLYGTSDLATIRYRMETWSPDALLYVVDHRQSLHFEQLFAAARRWGCGELELRHIGFGTVLGDDGRPFKTRSGDTVGLNGLLDEAVRRADEIVSANDDAKPDGAELTADERRRIAEVVGIAALKYADLSQNRTSDYTFSYDKMLALKGNTATYMQYAYARVRSIFRKGGVTAESVRARRPAVGLAHPAERALGLAILRFAEGLEAALADYRPNQLTAYLFELANQFSTFFEQCPVLKAPDEATRLGRLYLCDLTARTLAKGLELLGIEVVEKM